MGKTNPSNPRVIWHPLQNPIERLRDPLQASEHVAHRVKKFTAQIIANTRDLVLLTVKMDHSLETYESAGEPETRVFIRHIMVEKFI